MSHPLASAAVDIDWKLVAAAAATFAGTLIVTIWGWIQGRKKSEVAATTTPQFQVAGAVLQDNTSLRDNTQAVKDLRDQIMFLRDCIERRTRTEDELNGTIEDLIRRLDKVA